MTKASDNQFPKVTFAEGSAPSTPASGLGYLYEKTDGKVYFKNDGATEYDLTLGGTGAVATDAIWDAAGDLAVGTGADTAAKLAIGAAGGALSVINSAVAWNSGTSFPANKATGDRYWRTDLGLECYWDGTRWVTTRLYREGFTTGDTLTPQSAANSYGYWAPWHTTYDLWLVTLYSTTFVLTTNDGSKYWTVTLQKSDAANSDSTIVSFNTSGDTASNWTTRATSIDAALTPATYKVLKIRGDKTSTPGNLYASYALAYRVIVT